MLAPAILHGLLPAQPAGRKDSLDELLAAVSTSVSSLSSDSREQLARLLAALDYRITRWLLTGLWKPLHEATVAEIDAFLHNWRQSSVGRFNLAYRTLTPGCWRPTGLHCRRITSSPVIPGRLRGRPGKAPYARPDR